PAIQRDVRRDNPTRLSVACALTEKAESLTTLCGEPAFRQRDHSESATSATAGRRFRGNCNHCGRYGHMRRDCRRLKEERNSQAEQQRDSSPRKRGDNQRQGNDWGGVRVEDEGQGSKKVEAKPVQK